MDAGTRVGVVFLGVVVGTVDVVVSETVLVVDKEIVLMDEVDTVDLDDVVSSGAVPTR